MCFDFCVGWLTFVNNDGDDEDDDSQNNPFFSHTEEERKKGKARRSCIEYEGEASPPFLFWVIQHFMYDNYQKKELYIIGVRRQESKSRDILLRLRVSSLQSGENPPPLKPQALEHCN